MPQVPDADVVQVSNVKRRKRRKTKAKIRKTFNCKGSKLYEQKKRRMQEGEKAELKVWIQQGSED